MGQITRQSEHVSRGREGPIPPGEPEYGTSLNRLYLTRGRVHKPEISYVHPQASSAERSHTGLVVVHGQVGEKHPRYVTRGEVNFTGHQFCDAPLSETTCIQS